MKKKTLCQHCNKKTDHRLKFRGKTICLECLDILIPPDLKYEHKNKI